MPIQGITTGVGLEGAFAKAAAAPKSAPPGEGFGRLLGEMVDKVNGAQLDADKAIQGLMTGDSKGLHEVMIALEKSSISFQFLSQVRNKAVEAYQEIMRMPV